MTTITKDIRVGNDGNVVVALGKSDAGRLVRVTVEPAPGNGSVRDNLTPQEWLDFLDRTSGKWVGDFPETQDAVPEGRHEL